MKRISLILIALLSGFAATAAVVSPERAQETARAFFGGVTVSPVADASVSPTTDAGETKAASGLPEIYLFNNPSGGWVIIAGEDSVSPVLAYSRSGSFTTEGMPSNLAWWMGCVKSGVAKARREGRVAGTSVRRAWQSVGQDTKSAGRQMYLETATWYQYSPYNFFCPEVTESEGEAGEKVYTSLTGCAATAAAIVMRYNQYPKTGTGTLPDYYYLSDNQIPMEIKGYDISSHKYNYDQMPLSDEEVQKAGSASQQQIAQLIHDIGVSFKSEYNYKNGTSVSETSILQPLVEHFGYSSALHAEERQGYNMGDWIELLKTELDKQRPLLYSGYSQKGGHMFVLAGYDEKDFFYVNWGWAGRSNGYFTILDLIIDKDYYFNQGQTAYLGMVPEQGGQYEQNLLFMGKGITVTSGSVVTGQDFKITADAIYNSTYLDYEGPVRAALVDINDQLKCYVGPEYNISVPKYSEEGSIHYTVIDDYTCNVPQEMNYGDGITFFHKTNLGEWKIVPYDHESGGIFRYGAYDACAIRIPESVKAGDVIAPSILPGQTVISKVVWFLDGTPVLTGQTDPLAAGAHTLIAVVTFADGNTETIVQDIKVE